MEYKSPGWGKALPSWKNVIILILLVLIVYFGPFILSTIVLQEDPLIITAEYDIPINDLKNMNEIVIADTKDFREPLIPVIYTQEDNKCIYTFEASENDLSGYVYLKPPAVASQNDIPIEATYTSNNGSLEIVIMDQ